MALETLSIPEEHLADVINVIRAGCHLRHDQIDPEVYARLTQWCNDEDDYLHQDDDDDIEPWAPTHRSKLDGSEARWIGTCDNGDGDAVFQNENGDEWPDLLTEWEEIR